MKGLKIALIGNPNVGKTTLFNKLTGLNQKVGNYPGVTVDKKYGYYYYNNTKIEIVDLPGIYSLYPSSFDEEIVFKILDNNTNNECFDKIIHLADASNLKRSLLLFQQIHNLIKIPILIVINMLDEANRKGIYIDIKSLEKFTFTKVICINARKNIGIEQLKYNIKYLKVLKNTDFDPGIIYKQPVEKIKNFYNLKSSYAAWHLLASADNLSLKKEKEYLKYIIINYKIVPKRLKIKETIDRYKNIENIINMSVKNNSSNVYSNFSERIDYYIIHPFWGYWIFFILLFIVFQSVYYWAETPKIIIENFFVKLQLLIVQILPKCHISNLITHGIVPGICTIISFIPQISVLMIFLLLMEESGYINRVVFFMNRLMKPFGLNGKSIVPLISASACAIPAIMSARNIENYRDRLITIMVTPFIACSARLPVYTLIISLVIPNKKIGIFDLKGIVLMGMYFLGVFAALFGAMILHKILQKKYHNYLIMEIPSYRWPSLNNIFISLYIQLKSFILGAGKIIMAVNIVLWVLGSFGPNYFGKKNIYNNNIIYNKIPLEQSYLGIVGKKIEPLIKPLGYDWKIGIGLLSSLVAREVFVSTMATVYSLNDNTTNNINLEKRMSEEYRSENGKKLYDLPTGFSLLIFYAFSIQCISTLAIVKREMKSWKWPVIQFLSMTSLAYLSSFIIYNLLNN